MEHEGRLLLPGLHVVPQACLGDSQQLCVSVGVPAQRGREGTPLLTAPPHCRDFPPSLPLSLPHSSAGFYLFPLPTASHFSPLSCLLLSSTSIQGLSHLRVFSNLDGSMILSSPWSCLARDSPPRCQLLPSPSPAGRHILHQTPPRCTPLAPGEGARAAAAAGCWDPPGSLAGNPLQIAGPLWKLPRSWHRWRLHTRTRLGEPPLCPGRDESQHIAGNAISLSTARPSTGCPFCQHAPSPPAFPLCSVKKKRQREGAASAHFHSQGHYLTYLSVAS